VAHRVFAELVGKAGAVGNDELGHADADHDQADEGDQPGAERL
jgi:hypothetical protein